MGAFYAFTAGVFTVACFVAIVYMSLRIGAGC